MFNETLALTITFGLVGMVVVNILTVMYFARKADKEITAEVMKADKRLRDQINSGVG